MIPNIFIGSSVEGKHIADAIQVGLHHDARCRVWHQAFALSNNTIDSIIEGASSSDFAVFVFSPDDMLQLRGATYEATRDNVLFETGLFMGMHGKGRVFIVTPKSSGLRIPTDLLD
jgi:predicted nucleotide-binding protein